ncbi:hypothetical protein [Priestia megaterium]|uniref:hypothetical protein n=1 Tax=Priestia megaterium TaxID=1404 RepID=UPI003CC55905
MFDIIKDLINSYVDIKTVVTGIIMSTPYIWKAIKEKYDEYKRKRVHTEKFKLKDIDRRIKKKQFVSLRDYKYLIDLPKEKLTKRQVEFVKETNKSIKDILDNSPSVKLKPISFLR